MENGIRSIDRVVHSVRALEGAGFLVHRSFPTQALSDFDPFLLLDEMGPSELKPGEAKGAPDHPHRGFETVTYMLSGRMEHKDSRGNSGQLGPGDVQWMTAGAGLVHSEMPESEFTRTGGRMHGFQLWVNLPRDQKMIEPRYQEIPGARIPTRATDDGSVKVRVIAGAALGASAVIETQTPIIYLHFTLAPGAAFDQEVTADYNAFAYVVEGRATFGYGPESRTLNEHEMVIFRKDGNRVRMTSAAGTELLLIAGVPLNEPVARWGPFVMNTKAEIYQAIEDYQNGRLGNI
jgi:redox-sensitive bicupin YhaK (pirin superfamily)